MATLSTMAKVSSLFESELACETLPVKVLMLVSMVWREEPMSVFASQWEGVGTFARAFVIVILWLKLLIAVLSASVCELMAARSALTDVKSRLDSDADARQARVKPRR